MSIPDDVIEREIFDWLCKVYVQRADTRQRSLRLQYMEAETHDLAQGLAKLQRARERSEGEAVAHPDGYQNPTDEIWFDHPADLNLLEVFVDGLKVGDEYEIDVCWTGKQKFIVRTVNADGDVDEVDFVSGDVLFTTPQRAKPEVREALEKIAFMGCDSAPGTDKEYFYRSQLFNCIGIARHVLDALIEPKDEQEGGT